MIVTSIAAWLAMLAVFLLAGAAGYTLSRLLPWSSAARLVGVPWAVGFALGPFLLGGGSVLVLGFLPGSSHTMHIALVITGLVVLIVLAVLRHGTFGVKNEAAIPKVFGEYLLSVLLALWLVMLFINSIFLPLLQNDALEYATVGRLMYETRDLGSYPAIHPEQSASGFFGPWTHPPLYVSLIYLMQVIQGHADEPGFMRLIAPWFVACATFLVLALGSLISRVTGLVAAVIFLSTPLLFAGADSALIDALPVLGIGLVATAILCVEARPVVRGGIVGMALALALWTHSQAVLFLPLAVGAIALHNGVRDLRSTVQESISLGCITISFGLWPYWRNQQIFGSPISDNPAVFALPSLDWQGYFAIGRGLDNWAAILQYGLLKGWFSFEAYGWSFWLMSLGVPIAFKTSIRPTWRAIVSKGGRRALDPSGQVLWVSLALISLYLSGVLVSVLAGLDLMIKNERYMLVILPFVAILAGYGAQVILVRGALFVASSQNSSWMREALAASAIALALVLLLQLIILAGYYRWRHAPPSIKITIADDSVTVSQKEQELKKPRFRRALEMFPNTSAMLWARENLPSDALVLSLRPADMYYAQRKMVSYLDERLLPVYGENSPRRAAKMLRDLGVTHLHVPDYGLPVSYNSVLDRIIEDSSLSRLLYTTGGTQILHLLQAQEVQATPVGFQSVDFTPRNIEWTMYRQINLGGRKALGALGISGERLEEDGVSVTGMDVPVFHRDFSTVVANGLGAPLALVRRDSMLRIENGREYRVIFDLEGQAFIRILMIQFDASGQILKPSKISEGTERIAEIVLTESAENMRVSRRFLALPEAAYVRFGIEHVGHSRVTIKRAVLEFPPDAQRVGS
jgi:4-amino-4-deoxy-L-arabinose transferase-like glycosyltransferase